MGVKVLIVVAVVVAVLQSIRGLSRNDLFPFDPSLPDTFIQTQDSFVASIPIMEEITLFEQTVDNISIVSGLWNSLLADW